MKTISSLLFTSVLIFSLQANVRGEEKAVEINNDQVNPATLAKPDSIPMVMAIKTVDPTNSQAIDALDLKNEAIKNGTLKRISVKNLCIAYPNNIIRFVISNPLTFLKSRPRDQDRVVIYANGFELKGICTSWYSAVTNIMLSTGHAPVFGKTDSIDIVLKRNDTTQAAWNLLYSHKPDFFSNHIDLDASIGWEGMTALEKSPAIPHTTIVFYYTVVFWCYTALFVLLLAGFTYLAFWTNTIREGDNLSPYSLSQTQLLFWTTLIIGAFIYSLVLTDTPTSLNESILLILGISLSTTGVATIIDSRFKRTTGIITRKTNGFWRDALTSDGTSYSVQRIQVFAWNLVLGLYFIVYTIATKSMPVFSSTLLFLAGITSASYVGTKVPENNDLKASVTRQNNGTGANTSDTVAAQQQPAQQQTSTPSAAVG